MNKNKAFSNKTLLFIFLIASIIFLTIFIYFLVCLILNIINTNKNTIISDIIILCFLFPFLYLFLFCLNRMGCIVYYNEKTNKIGRKGFFFGFKHEVSVLDIKDVVISTMPFETKYIIIVDKKGRSYETLSKLSFIRLKYNQKNLEFIKDFWEKPIAS